MVRQVLFLTALDSRNLRNLCPGIEQKIRVLSLARIVNIPVMHEVTCCNIAVSHN